ncbi:MAG: L,D-transpeptidase family protein [Shewanella sp.]
MAEEIPAKLQGNYPLLTEQVLLLDLAGVSPIFSEHYQMLLQLSAGQTSSSQTLALQTSLPHTEASSAPIGGQELSIIHEHILRYWQGALPQTMARRGAVDPLHDESYRRVLRQVSHLLELDKALNWPELTLEEKLTLGQTHSIVPIIAARLLLLGDLDHELGQDMVYSDALQQAIKGFQRRHGLQADGVIGKQTLFWLNQSPRKRAELLAKNTIRQKRFSDTLAASYLLINIPAFEMNLVEQGQKVLTSKVIVGKASRPTPLLDSQISSVVLNPSWRVPSSILRKDILPHIRKDGHYINERGFDVYDRKGTAVVHSPEEWRALASEHFPYYLVQRPGPKNALGKYKFHFDNSFSVYLHGTAEPQLFKKDNRALSSGCIRIEKVDELAEWFKSRLVKEPRLWDKLAPKVGQPQWFSLSEKLPVHLVYWTAWLDDDGRDQYRNDIYHLEAELNNAVAASMFIIP